jgi:hypothetical protein
MVQIVFLFIGIHQLTKVLEHFLVVELFTKLYNRIFKIRTGEKTLNVFGLIDEKFQEIDNLDSITFSYIFVGQTPF